ncbi:MAG: hypothetical protein RMN25_04380 [Anaerolineae bacterium]|nr:hypothetical protein [Thermoflexales bacterium]MDW8406999.1 hypothetical protein [Anaerolineae bacterium]
MSKLWNALKLAGGVLGILIGAIVAYWVAVSPWHVKWGATDDEAALALPGDELVPNPTFKSTRAITIHAPPADIWPWLMQMGQGRGGMYSYDLLENLFRLDLRSVDRVVPELQNLKVGDVIPIEPSGSGYTVVDLQPNERLLLLAQGAPQGIVGQSLQAAGGRTSWLFLLRPIDTEHTQLIVRWRARINVFKSPLALALALFIEPLEFIMERKMMLGIKERAEKLSRSKTRRS